MTNDREKLSYSLGLNIAANLKQQGIIDIDPQLVGDGLVDAFKGAGYKMDPQEAGAFLSDHFTRLEAKKHETAIKAGEDFLAVNGKKEGVITLESGLQYQILNEGKGDKPSLTSKVTTHYHGTTVDGKVFDSSVERGSPASFPVNGVIPGWTEALQLMGVGSKWRLTVPSKLAYGERGAGPKIGPHATLIFDVELLKIED